MVPAHSVRSAAGQGGGAGATGTTSSASASTDVSRATPRSMAPSDRAVSSTPPLSVESVGVVSADEQPRRTMRDPTGRLRMHLSKRGYQHVDALPLVQYSYLPESPGQVPLSSAPADHDGFSG